RRRVELLAHIGHGQRRQAAERQPQQGAQYQQQLPVIDQRAGDAQHTGQAQGAHHHRFAPPALGQGAGHQHGEGQAQGGQRQRQAAAGGGHAKVRRQQRKQGLHAVQESEGGKTGTEQRQGGPAVIGTAALDIAGRIGGGRHSGKALAVRPGQGRRAAYHFSSRPAGQNDAGNLWAISLPP